MDVEARSHDEDTLEGSRNLDVRDEEGYWIVESSDSKSSSNHLENDYLEDDEVDDDDNVDDDEDIEDEDEDEEDEEDEDDGIIKMKKSVKKKNDSPNKKSSPKNKNGEKEKVFMWCHQCKQKHVEVVYCTRTCSKKYCTRCVWRHYREKVDDIEQQNWVCYYCQGVCSCAFCRRRRAKETNTKFESHRGKKRRITVDTVASDQPQKMTKKRKIKSSSSSPLKVIKNTTKVSSPKSSPLKNSSSQKLPVVKAVKIKAEPSFKPSPLKVSTGAIRTTREVPEQKRPIPPEEPIISQKEKRQNSNKGRVTLKDLIDTKILNVGDELSFRNGEQPAKLLADGFIEWSDTVYRSLSTFAKKVAYQLGAGAKGTLYNGWRVVYCRGKVMDQYRKDYRRYLSSNRLVTSSDRAPRVAEVLSLGGKIPNSTSPRAGKAPPAGKSEEDPYDLYMDVGKVEQFDYYQIKEESEGDSIETEQWWVDEEDTQIASPISDDLLLFDTTTPSTFPERERDLLVIGHVDEFLDIRDKDFFNVTSSDDNLHVFTKTSVSHLEDSVNSSFTEAVPDFYPGGSWMDYEF